MARPARNAVKAVTAKTAEKPVEKPVAAETKTETVEVEAKEAIKEEEKTTSSLDKQYKVVSKTRANKSVLGTTGKVITFDKDGVVYVGLEEALHFKRIPDCEVEG